MTDDVTAEAVAQAVRSKFPEGNLVLSDPYAWADPPTDRPLDFHLGWWSALRMVAELGENALNEFEHSIAGKVADLAADFIHLVGEGDTAAADFAEILPHLHALQQTVMAQAAARAHPGMYRALGDVEPAEPGIPAYWGPQHPHYDGTVVAPTVPPHYDEMGQ